MATPTTHAVFDASILPLLVCPRCRLSLAVEGSHLVCRAGHRYAIVEGIPILLLGDVQHNHIEATRSLAVAEQSDHADLPQFDVKPGTVDPFVQRAIGATNGALYQHLVGHMSEYPIPQLRLPAGEGRLFLEIGCNWGRWCLAAARLGYRPVGIDPSLKAIRAARRVAAQLEISAQYLVADGRYLPFADSIFDQVFSYSVLQHVPFEDVTKTLDEIHRTLVARGESLVQMPNAFGVRCAYHQLRRGFRAATGFEVRYWRPRQLLKAFQAIGSTAISVDGYLSLNPQFSDRRFLPRKYQAIVWFSEMLRRASVRAPWMANLADSLYLSSVRN